MLLAPSKSLSPIAVRAKGGGRAVSGAQGSLPPRYLPLTYIHGVELLIRKSDKACLKKKSHFEISTYENFKDAAGKLMQSSSWRNRALLKPLARSLLPLPQCQSRTAAAAASIAAAAAGNAYCAL